MAGPIYYEGQRAENPNDPNAPVLIYRGGKWVPESAVQNPFAAAQTSQKYADTMATGRAKRDEAKLAAASEAVADASKTTALADQIQGLLRRQSTGPGAIIAKPFSADLQSLERLGQEGVFGNLDKLKGPMSDKDIAFLKSQSVSPTLWGKENQRIVDLMRWSAKRSQEYESGLNAWTERLGSPSARNAQGLSYDAWWAKWSQQNLPRPDLSGKKAPLPGQPPRAGGGRQSGVEAMPQAGEVRDGWRFKGGNPNDQRNWQKVTP